MLECSPDLDRRRKVGRVGRCADWDSQDAIAGAALPNRSRVQGRYIGDVQGVQEALIHPARVDAGRGDRPGPIGEVARGLGDGAQRLGVGDVVGALVVAGGLLAGVGGHGGSHRSCAAVCGSPHHPRPRVEQRVAARRPRGVVLTGADPVWADVRWAGEQPRADGMPQVYRRLRRAGTAQIPSQACSWLNATIATSMVSAAVVMRTDSREIC